MIRFEIYFDIKSNKKNKFRFQIFIRIKFENKFGKLNSGNLLFEMKFSYSYEL